MWRGMCVIKALIPALQLGKASFILRPQCHQYYLLVLLLVQAGPATCRFIDPTCICKSL